MKIFETLKVAGLNLSAIVEVECGEIADVDAMLKLVGGDLDHFGVDVKLMGTTEPPTIREIVGRKTATRQFGFGTPSEVMSEKRYYHVYVHRQ
jgi:hypothetical protein